MEQASPEGAFKSLSSDDVLEFSVEDLRQELETHGIDTKAMTKIQMQKLLMKFVVSRAVSKEELQVKSKELELKLQQELEVQKQAQNFEIRKLEIAAEKAKFDAENAKIAADVEKEKTKIAADAELEKKRID